jgi:hypothetical protein
MKAYHGSYKSSGVGSHIQSKEESLTISKRLSDFKILILPLIICNYCFLSRREEDKPND